MGGYHREWDKYINQEVNLQDRFGGIALVTYEAQGWAKVGNDGGQQRWATKSLERVRHKRGTGDQEDDEEPRTR